MRLEDMTSKQQDYMVNLLDLYEYDYVDETHMKDNQFNGLLVEKTLEWLLEDYVYLCENICNNDDYKEKSLIDQYYNACDMGIEIYPNNEFFRYMRYENFKEVC